MSSMREDFEAAIEESGAEYAEPRNEILTAEEDTPEPVSPDTETPTSESPDTPEVATESVPAEAAGDEPEAAPVEEGLKPPVGFSPAARENWKDVPKTVQEQIHKREQEIAQAMHGTAEARKVHESISQLAQSYAPIMAAEGTNNPLQAIQGLFETVAELRMGSPAQKAQKMASLIQHYGIDIGSLDSALSGQVPEDPQQHQFETMIDQKLAPINQVMEQLNQMQAGKQQQTAVAAQQEIQQFEQQAEFLSDVRNDMADLIDMAAARGHDMGLEEAYNKACIMSPQISQILEQRKQTAALTSGQQNINAKLAAGSSITGQPNGTSTAAPTSLRAQLEAAWDESMQG
jgi:hypothetical protein